MSPPPPLPSLSPLPYLADQCLLGQLTYCTPYLLSLGMSKSHMSLVWTAAPLSGLIVQPLIGMMSDKSRSKYGRRRPFMLAGTAAVGVCYLVLGWAKEIAGWWVGEGGEGEGVWYITGG